MSKELANLISSVVTRRALSVAACQCSCVHGDSEILLNTEEKHQMNAQLHLILVGVLRDEPLNSVKNAPDSDSYDAWRKLTGHCDSKQGS